MQKIKDNNNDTDYDKKKPHKWNNDDKKNLIIKSRQSWIITIKSRHKW